jgi:hypothetical protein
MFLLSFYKLVERLLKWTDDPPPKVVLNEHQQHTVRVGKDPCSTFGHDNIPRSADEIELLTYILLGYSDYFALEIRMGNPFVHSCLTRV